MKTTITVLLLGMITSGCAMSAPEPTNSPAVSKVQSEYRVWTRRGERLGPARVWGYGKDPYKHEVWLQARPRGKHQPVRIRVKLDYLSDADIKFLREFHADGFPGDYQRLKKGKSEQAPRECLLRDKEKVSKD